jgi:hypothetical protein
MRSCRRWRRTGAQVGPGFAQLVLVQRGLAVRGATPFSTVMVGGHAGQAGLGRRVAPLAGVDVDLHVDDGQAGLSTR